MTEPFLTTARRAFGNGEDRAAAAAALIAIAEALQPRPEPKPEPPATIDRDLVKRHRASALRDLAYDITRGPRHNWVATEIAAALRERADLEEGVTDADPT